MIRILSGWSNPGGSTTSWINLTNLFNENNVNTIFYGPHDFHLNKCRSEKLNNFQYNKKDVIIVHFLKIDPLWNVRKKIFGSHEQDIFPVKNINYKLYDKIHFVSEHQREYHNLNYPNFIIENPLDDLKPSENPVNIAGVIGSIDKNKNVHLSIERALNDGFQKVLLYGLITDRNYFYKHIQPLMMKYKNKVIHCGYNENKQKMYDSISAVYQDSKLESWGYIKAECKLTNTKFYGNSSTKNMKIVSNDKIFYKWLKEII